METSNLSKMSEAIEIEINELEDCIDAERAAAAMDKVRLWNDIGRELKKKLEEQLIRFIKTNGEITIGTVRYYVGAKKTTRCNNLGETARTMLELGGPELLSDVLSANAFKHGEAKKRLAELDCAGEFDRLFTTTTEEELKDGVAAKKDSLLSVDSRFTR